ncbi:precorrin-6A synthase (deacetylating) [Actinomadura barringtoniae]|uniref:Precorrin-6A synthase (Deacetylating) n=1 Tax=Actinomadura barringtoniae TaxID=1427535 RepID=A0A939P8E4_9ACTN|nr:precorrin-6A synthase (deacetylating) [Actinomadura barringtoniae]MBO2447600.1 precorrin-6A synthase (deacetylating) [Actinomadura barringtoniae]
MAKILVIGIGAGDPGQLTLQAVAAIGATDVFFVLDKGEIKQELAGVRQEILDRHARDRAYRVVTGQDPDRDRAADGYVEAVEDWRRRRADVCAALITDNLGEGQTGAFLVWGDPALYDSTLAILDDLTARGLSFDVEVVPGISCVAALTARHGIALNQVGAPVQITTGRRLAEQWPSGTDDVVVMLDARNAFTDYADQDDVEIYYGAYLGMPDEILIAGPLPEVADRIVAERAEAKERKGWIMDTYLLRRTRTSHGGG